MSIFSKLNLHFGYYQVHITEGDELKIAFTTRYKLFQFIVMSFELTNFSTTFCSLVNVVFRYLDIFTIIYLDDILFYNSLEEYCRYPWLIFEGEVFIRLGSGVIPGPICQKKECQNGSSESESCGGWPMMIKVSEL